MTMKIGSTGLEMTVTPGGSCSGSVCLTQIHSARVLLNPSSGQEADGMILSGNGASPALKVADCLPVFAVWDSFTGACHAGWRGLASGIVENMLGMVDEPLRYLVLGPCICGECYEVEEDVREQVARTDPAGLSAFPPGRVDLRASAIRRARHLAGDRFKVVSDSRCTMETEELFSYRRNGTSCRNLVRLAEACLPEHIHRPL